jgi:hypothetical protein
MATLTEVKLAKLNDFRAGLLSVKKENLTAKALHQYWESNRDKLRPSGIVDNLGRYLQTIADIDDTDALDGARDDLVRMVDITITSLNGADVRPILDDLITKVKDAKLSSLLREFNAIKNQQPNLAARSTNRFVSDHPGKSQVEPTRRSLGDETGFNADAAAKRNRRENFRAGRNEAFAGIPAAGP